MYLFVLVRGASLETASNSGKYLSGAQRQVSQPRSSGDGVRKAQTARQNVAATSVN